MEHVFQVDIAWVTFVAGSVIPLLTGLITKAKASPAVKAGVNGVLCVAAGVCAVVVQAKGAITAQQLVTGVFSTFLTSGVMYNHAWVKFGVAQKVQGIAPGSGLGSPVVANLVGSYQPSPMEHVEPKKPTDVILTGESTGAGVGAQPLPEAAMKEADNSLLADKGFLAFIYPVNSSEED